MLSVWTDIMILFAQKISQVHSTLERVTLSLSDHIQARNIVSIVNLLSSIRSSSLNGGPQEPRQSIAQTRAVS